MLFYKHFKSRQIVIQLPTCLIHCPTNNMLPDTNSQHTPAFMTHSFLVPHLSFLIPHSYFSIPLNNILIIASSLSS